MKQTILTLAMLTCLPALAQRNLTHPLDEYRFAADFAPMECRAAATRAQIADEREAKSGLNGRDPHKEWFKVIDCVNTQSEQVKKAYLAATKSLANNPKAQSALKEHLVMVIEQTKGVLPHERETETDYFRRASGLRAATSQAWTRFEIERQ